jgi:hypothetical protein
MSSLCVVYRDLQGKYPVSKRVSPEMNLLYLCYFLFLRQAAAAELDGKRRR